MSLGHQQLDVYRVAIEYVAWVYHLCEKLQGHRNARDQLLRASQAIPLNIAEGNGKLPSADRQRFLRIALGSALECAATLDVLTACRAIDSATAAEGNPLRVRIVSMLTKMSSIALQVREGVEYEYDEQTL